MYENTIPWDLLLEQRHVSYRLKAENPGKVRLAVNIRIKQAMADMSLGRGQGPQMQEDTGASPLWCGCFGQRLAAKAELGWWWVPWFGVFQMGVPAPDMETWSWGAPRPPG